MSAYRAVITSISGWYDWPTAGICRYDGIEYSFRTYFVGGWFPTEDDSDCCYVPRVYTLHDPVTGEKLMAATEDEFILTDGIRP